MKITPLNPTQTFKIKARWSLEEQEDMNAYHDHILDFQEDNIFIIANYLHIDDKTALGEEMNWFLDND